MKNLKQHHIFKIDDLVLYDNEKFVYKVTKTEDIIYTDNGIFEQFTRTSRRNNGKILDQFDNPGYQRLTLVWHKNISIFNSSDKKVRTTSMTRQAANYNCKLITKDLINNFVTRLYDLKSELGYYDNSFIIDEVN